MLLNKKGNNNFKSDLNHTLVDLDNIRVSAFVASYRKYQVTSSYFRHPTKKDWWRPFRSDEIAAFLNIPSEFYTFPDFMGEGVKTKLLGQGIDGNAVKAIQIEAAVALMANRYRKIAKTTYSHTEINCQIINEEGLGAFLFGDVSQSAG
ncbi:hypothetical protein [Cohnella silvisoli]|uniref:DNA (cytosine-5-)-methyltransferase n=1 Tax=Cohnella silvisoli TaxID=2873699 RepID=A0ABV1L0V8_9BACL|nr:hypothetical protein [Cohnella silvisoli]MCD9025056.1 hypothetical protein [Cohnella silvisoli]